MGRYTCPEITRFFSIFIDPVDFNKQDTPYHRFCPGIADKLHSSTYKRPNVILKILNLKCHGAFVRPPVGFTYDR